MHLRSRPEPRDRMSKFQAGLGLVWLSQPPALPHLPGSPWSVPCPSGPWAQGPWKVPTWSLLTPCGHDSGSRSRSREHRRETGQGVGRKISPKRKPARAHTPARGKAARSSGDASSWTPGRLGTQRPRGPATGRGNTDSKRPEQGGAASPPPPPAWPAHRVLGPLGTRCPLSCDARRGFCPWSPVWSAVKVFVSSSPDFLI